MKGTTFGTIHSNTDLALIQQSVVVSPAVPRTYLVDVPGADGSKDLTEALGVGVKYQDRTITWTFALYPGDNWEQRKQIVNGALNGLACNITLDDDPNYYYVGRVSVTDHALDGIIKQITVEAICRPYKLKKTETDITRSDLTTNYKQLSFTTERMPVVPQITLSAAATVQYNGATYALAAGTHIVPAICFNGGDQIVKVKLDSGSDGTVHLIFREGAL